MLLKPSEPWAMTADLAAQRSRSYMGGSGARSELALRNEIEAFARARWPDARICHEMVMGEGKVRADMVAIGLDHIVAFEVKGGYDDTTRLLHQVGMYQLCVPEVWMVVSEGHAGDARLIRHLLPSVGLLVGDREGAGRDFAVDWKAPKLVVEAEATPRPVIKDMLLRICWAAEIHQICDRTRTVVGKRPTREAMVKSLLDLPIDTLQREVCTALRGRDAVWRADPPVTPE